jgi:hypothetical protein
VTLLAAFLWLPLVALGQQPLTGNASAVGACSPATTGSNNQITLNCAHLTPEQRQIILNMPDLINKLLVQQRESTLELISRLDACIVQGAPRSVTPEQRRRIIADLANPTGAPEIRVRATNSNNESSRFAGQLQDAFANTPGWTAPLVFENMVAGATLPTGLIAVVQDQHNINGIAIQRLFAQIGISIQFEIDATLPPNIVVMVVYQKPIQ